MTHTVRDKKKLIIRTNKIRGQLDGLNKLLEQEQDCTAVLQQIAAIKGAVNGLMRVVIEEHLKEHIVHQVDEQQREQELEVILQILKSYT